MDSTETEQAGQGPAPDASPIRVETAGRVVVIAYNRPERHNAWNTACVRETIAAIRRANASPDVGAIVLTGEGPSFCSGVDLKADPDYHPQTGRRLTPATYTMGTGDDNWISLLAQSKPVVAAINGPAVGIGATHPLAADIRVMAESAHFSFPFLRLGAMPECGSSALLPRLIGAGRATDILLRSGKISASEALQWGLVTQVFPDAELRAGAIAIAQQLAELKPLQVSLTKHMLHANAESGDAEAIMRVESKAFGRMLKALKQETPMQQTAKKS